MKTDKKLLAAVILLIALVAWLIFLSVKRDDQIDRLNQRIENIKVNHSDLSKYGLSEVKPEKVEVHGKPGSDGNNGVDGDSAYEIAVKAGFIGTEKEWVESLKVKGENGSEGDSSYQIAVKNGFVGTELEWLESLKVKGDAGPTGPSLDIDCINGFLSKKLSTATFWNRTNIRCEEVIDE